MSKRQRNGLLVWENRRAGVYVFKVFNHSYNHHTAFQVVLDGYAGRLVVATYSAQGREGSVAHRSRNQARYNALKLAGELVEDPKKADRYYEGAV